jgi:hypothetical protein
VAARTVAEEVAYYHRREQHYWVRAAIDGFTSQVIHKQIEVVNE